MLKKSIGLTLCIFSLVPLGAVHATEPVATTELRTAAACPSQNFTQFLKAFRSNEQVQRAFTATPLPHTYLDDDFKEKTVPRKASEIHFPVISSEKKLKKFAVKPKVIVQKDGMLVVEWFGNANTTKYKFSKKSGCWQLVATENLSP